MKYGYKSLSLIVLLGGSMVFLQGCSFKVGSVRPASEARKEVSDKRVAMKTDFENRILEVKGENKEKIRRK